jgi:hypothetical protein
LAKSLLFSVLLNLPEGLDRFSLAALKGSAFVAVVQPGLFLMEGADMPKENAGPGATNPWMSKGKRQKYVPQPKTGLLKAVGCRPLKISSLRNGKAANLLK